MTESVELRETVDGLINGGDTVALEGFTHLIPFAAAHEIIRQKKRDLTLVRMTQSGTADYTTVEMMIAASHHLEDGVVCFVGISLPSEAANLARATHAPNCFLIYESGTLGAKPDVLPLSIGDGVLAEHADSVVSVPERLDETAPPTGEELEILRDLRARTDASRQRSK